jgi:dynactin complex subunit
MMTATDQDLRQLKDLITAGNAVTQKQVVNLTLETKVGFTKLDGNIRDLRSELKALDTKFDEKTKNLDQRITGKEFINRGVAVGLTVTVVGGVLLAFGKILFFGKVL